MPPTLFVYGERDEVVPLAEAQAMEKLTNARQLSVTIKAYPVGHVFQKKGGDFDIDALLKAQQLMTEFLEKHLKRQETARRK